MTLEELALVVKVVSVAGTALWGGTVAVVGTLWKHTREVNKRLAKLQEEAAEGNALREMVSGCAVVNCPMRALACGVGCGLLAFISINAWQLSREGEPRAITAQITAPNTRP